MKHLIAAACLACLVGASRLLFAASVDHPALAALGMTRRQLAAAGLVKVGVAAAAATVLAAGAAVAASPLMPLGPARLAEPSPGVSADVPVLLIGSAATVALLLARAALPAWRLASAGYRRTTPLIRLNVLANISAWSMPVMHCYSDP